MASKPGKGFKKVWAGPMGELTWNLTLRLYELPWLGRRSWWWKLRLAMWREFRGLDVHSFSQRIQGPSPESLAYGETPLASLLKVLQAAELAPGARFVDVGCGRGNLVLGAACLGYPAVGLDYFPQFVERSRRVAARLGCPATFQAGDFFESGLPDGELYFVAATAFGERTRERLLPLLEDVPAPAVVVTLDWVLESDRLELTRQFYLPVSWGVALACLHVRCSSENLEVSGRNLTERNGFSKPEGL